MFFNKLALIAIMGLTTLSMAAPVAAPEEAAVAAPAAAAGQATDGGLAGEAGPPGYGGGYGGPGYGKLLLVSHTSEVRKSTRPLASYHLKSRLTDSLGPPPGYGGGYGGPGYGGYGGGGYGRGYKKE